MSVKNWLLIIFILFISIFLSLLMYLASKDSQWSPDGEWIAFECIRANNIENDEIYRVRPDGSEIELITDNDNHNGDPNWSPDGEWILFSSWQPTGNDNRIIYRMHPDGTEQKPLFQENLEGWEPFWSPNGEWIAFISSGDIYKMRANGGDVTRLTYYQTALYSSPAIRNLSWSPDGEWIAFEQYANHHSDIYRIHPDGTNEQRLTFREENNHNPNWSPDSKWIIFHSEGKIFIMKADGQDLRVLAEGSKTTSLSSASYSPDGKWIAYTGREGNQFSQIYKMHFDGSNIIQITNVNCYASDPVWSPQISTPINPTLEKD